MSSAVTEQVNRTATPPPVPTNFRYSPLIVSQSKPVNFSWDSSPSALSYEVRIHGGCLTTPELRTIAEVTPPPTVRFVPRIASRRIG